MKDTRSSAVEAGFSQLIEVLAELRALVAERAGGDATLLAEGHHYLAGMLQFYLERSLKSHDLQRPCFVRDMDAVRSWGLPAPDHHYFSAQIDGAGSYRISGQRGNTVDFCFEVLTGLAGDNGVIGGRIDALEADRLHLGPDGRYTLYVGGDKRPSNWLKSGPNARVIFVRQTVSDWRREQPEPMLIERLDTAAERCARRAPEEVRALYETAAKGLRDQVRFLSDFAKQWLQALPLNECPPPAVGPADAGYFPGQYNTKCRFRLETDEALVLEFEASAARYHSVALGHPVWFNSLRPRDVQSSLSNAQSRISSDGVFRYVVSAADPGVANWLDTTGLSEGFLFVRFQGVAPGQVPKPVRTRVIRVAELRGLFPEGEPLIERADRASTLRDRRLSIDRRYA